jgi:hypothetical protein
VMGCRSQAGDVAVIDEGQGSIFRGHSGTGEYPGRTGAFRRGQY